MLCSGRIGNTNAKTTKTLGRQTKDFLLFASFVSATAKGGKESSYASEAWNGSCCATPRNKMNNGPKMPIMICGKCKKTYRIKKNGERFK